MLVLKTGTKELLSNVKESNKIRQKMKEHGEESLTRQEARLVAKVQKDIKKLFPFALLFMVCKCQPFSSSILILLLQY